MVVRSVLASVCMLLALWPQAVHTADWQEVNAANPPCARTGHGMTTMPDGRIILFGGADEPQNVYNDLYFYDNEEWSPISASNTPPEARRNEVVWYRDGKLYIHGGVAKNHEMLDDLWAFDLAKREWAAVQTGTTKPPARYGHAATPLPDGSVILTGGTGASGTLLKDAWKLGPDMNYTPLGDAPGGMSHSVAHLVDGILYLFGASEKLTTYNTQTGQWAVSNAGPPIAGAATSALGVNASGQKVIHFFGGVDVNGAASDVVYEYNVATGNLSQRLERMPYAQQYASAATKNSHTLTTVIFGGINNNFYSSRTFQFSSGISSPTAQLTVARTGNGTVTSAPAGIDCGSSCAAAYAAGTTVVLTGVPADSDRFSGWSGAGCSAAPTCSVQMSVDRAVTATFVQRATPRGDVDQNGIVNLADAVLALQIAAGMSTAGKTVTLDADANNNGRIDLAEIVYILQKMAEKR